MNYLYVYLKTGYIHIKYRDVAKSFYLPLNIYSSEGILDYHHFFYLLKKYIEEFQVPNKTKIILFIANKNIIHINYKVPLIDEDDLENFLRLDLEDYGNLKIEEYKIEYALIKEPNTYELSISLIPLDLFKQFEEIFNRYNLSLLKILPNDKIYRDDGKYIEFDLDGIILIEISRGLCKKYEYIFSDQLLKTYADNGLEASNVINILEGKYDPMTIEIDEDFSLRLINIMTNYSNKIQEFVNENKINLGGILRNTNIYKCLNIKNYYICDNFEVFKNFKFNKIEKRKRNWKIPAIIFLFLLLISANMIYINKLDSKISTLNKNIKKDNVEEQIIDKDLSSDRYQQSNRTFFDKVVSLQKLENENLLFTDYIYEEKSILIKGIAQSEDNLKVFDTYEILEKSSTIEDGLYKFEIRIKMAD